MSPDFLQGFFTCLFIEGFGLAVWYTIRLYMKARERRCEVCQSPNIDSSGQSLFPVHNLAACIKCGETMPKSLLTPTNAVPICTLYDRCGKPHGTTSPNV